MVLGEATKRRVDNSFPIAWDGHALNVQIFLNMHRSDYAEKQLRIMQQIDEDHTLTQLANAWLNLAVITSLILNGKAVCCMHMGNFDEAESLLLEALNKGRMSEAELGAHSIKSHGASVASNHMDDWLILLLLVVTEIILYMINPFYLFVGEEMMADLKLPLKPNTVLVWTVPIAFAWTIMDV